MSTSTLSSFIAIPRGVPVRALVAAWDMPGAYSIVAKDDTQWGRYQRLLVDAGWVSFYALGAGRSPWLVKPPEEGPEHAARLATPSETEEGPGRVWLLWLVPGLWGAALGAVIVGLCWGVA